MPERDPAAMVFWQSFSSGTAEIIVELTKDNGINGEFPGHRLHAAMEIPILRLPLEFSLR